MSLKPQYKISVLIPCHNEAKSIRQCINSCLKQTHRVDEIIIVDDSSTDKTPEILATFGDRITVITTPSQTGNKSKAQEYGLPYVQGDIFITTDGDTILDPHFVEHTLKHFSDPTVAAVAGYVKSRKYNWLTACREIDYVVAQNFHKRAQVCMNSVFIIPGCAAAFRTSTFRKHVTFDHDTLTEDLDFSYKLYKRGFQIVYEHQSITYTQDPPNLRSYCKQMLRWYAGGWQNLLKHKDVVKRPGSALELSIMYTEGLASALLLLVLPILNFNWFATAMVAYSFSVFCFGVFASWKDHRLDLLLSIPSYIALSFITMSLFIYTFIKEAVLRKRRLEWIFVDRVEL